MTDADRYPLLFGPYQAPRFRVGGTLTCELRGAVTVTGVSKAPIPWPQVHAKPRRPSLVVCGGLSKALRRESGIAIAHWWGSHPVTVYEWRRRLGLSGVANRGMAQLNRRTQPLKASRVKQRPTR
jgi:hypothetical protein